MGSVEAAALGRDASIGARGQADFATVLTELGQAFLLASPDGEIVLASPRLCELMGSEASELTGRTLSRVLADGDGEVVARLLAQRGATGLAVSLLRDAGEPLLATIDAVATERGTEGDGELVVLVREVSPASSERDRLRASEAQLREAHSAARLMSWEWQVQSDRFVFSRELLEDVGVDISDGGSLEEMLTAVDSRDRTSIRRLFKELGAGERESFECSYRVPVPTGGELWVETRARLTDTARGSVLTVRGTTQDVTAQRVAQREMLAAEEFWQATLDSLAQHVCVLDEDGTIIAVNQAWRDFAAANHGTDVGMGANYLGVCDASHEEPAAALVADALRAIAAGEWQNVSVEYPCHSPDEERWFVMTANRYRGSGATRIVVQHENVTERKRAEDARSTSERQLREAQRVAQVGSFEVGLGGRTRLSDEMCVLYGIHPDEFDGDFATLVAQLPADDGEQLRGALLTVTATGERASLEHRFCPLGGQLRWAETRLEPLHDPEGALIGARGTSQDITGRKVAQDEAELQAHLLDAVDVSVIAVDLHGKVTHWNSGAEELYGWSRAEAIGVSVADLLLTDVDDPHVPDMRQQVLRAGHWEGEFPLRRKDGRELRVYARNALLENDRGLPIGIVGVSVDMTKRIEAEQRLRSAKDYLQAVTGSMGEGLYTVDAAGKLTYMNAAAEQMLGWTARELLGRPMHEATHYLRPSGEALPAAECPIGRARSEGIVVRAEDEVFIRRDGSALPVAYTAAPFETEEGVRGSAVVFRDVTAQREEEARLAAQLEAATVVGKIRGALANDRLVLYAQPIIDIPSGTVTQHELLIRMLDDDGTLLPPSRFLPVAEEHGLVQAIDHWVLGRAVELAARGLDIELNLSAETLSQPELAGLVERELGRTGADPKRLVFELTETAILRDEAAARAFIDHVAGLGCRVALDDFGTGYGSFTYLKRLPVDFLKVDVEFVRDLPSNSASQHVVQAVVALAHGFGLKTVAEGVEDEETLTMLRTYGIDYAQGFAIARPAPIGEVFDDAS